MIQSNLIRIGYLFRQARSLWDADVRGDVRKIDIYGNEHRGLSTSSVDPHWFRCGSGSGSSFFSMRIRSGSRERNQCGSMRIWILVRYRNRSNIKPTMVRYRSRVLKGTVSRDFLPQVFFMNHLPPSS